MLNKAQALADELIRLRREIHAHPELSFQEKRTAALVADTLQEIGIDVQTGVGRTGVVGQLGDGDGPTIAIRADMTPCRSAKRPTPPTAPRMTA